MADLQSSSLDEETHEESPGVKRDRLSSAPTSEEHGDDPRGRRSKRSRKLPDRLKDAVDVPGGEPLVLEETGRPASPASGAGEVREQGGAPGPGYGLQMARMMNPVARPMNPIMPEGMRHGGIRGHPSRHTDQLEEVVRLLIKRQSECSTKLATLVAEHQEVNQAVHQLAQQIRAIRHRLFPSAPSSSGPSAYAAMQHRAPAGLPPGVHPHALQQGGTAGGGSNGMGGEPEYQQLYDSLFGDNL